MNNFIEILKKMFDDKSYKISLTIFIFCTIMIILNIKNLLITSSLYLSVIWIIVGIGYNIYNTINYNIKEKNNFLKILKKLTNNEKVVLIFLYNNNIENYILLCHNHIITLLVKKNIIEYDGRIDYIDKKSYQFTTLNIKYLEKFLKKDNYLKNLNKEKIQDYLKDAIYKSSINKYEWTPITTNNFIFPVYDN